MNPKAQERSILFLFLLQQNIIINDIWFPGGAEIMLLEMMVYFHWIFQLGHIQLFFFFFFFKCSC